MLNNQEMPDNIKNILSSMNNNSSVEKDSSSKTDSSKNHQSQNFNNKFNSANSDSSQENQTSSNSTSSASNNIFGDFDINTMLKIQKIMSSMNNDKKDDSRTTLLMSLKPYLKDSRKSKVDQYVQLMKMGKIFEIMNPLGGDKKDV